MGTGKGYEDKPGAWGVGTTGTSEERHDIKIYTTPNKWWSESQVRNGVHATVFGRYYGTTSLRWKPEAIYVNVPLVDIPPDSLSALRRAILAELEHRITGAKVTKLNPDRFLWGEEAPERTSA